MTEKRERPMSLPMGTNELAEKVVDVLTKNGTIIENWASFSTTINDMPIQSLSAKAEPSSYPRSVFLRVDNMLFVTEDAKAMLPQEIRDDRRIAYLNEIAMFRIHQNSTLIGALTMATLSLLGQEGKLQGRNVVDLGSAEGIQGIVAFMQGAAGGWFIESDTGVNWENIWRSNIRGNHIPLQQTHFVFGSIRDDLVIDTLPADQIDIVIANFGTKYDHIDKRTVDLFLQKFLNASIYIGGGYQDTASDWKHMDSITEVLIERGYTIRYLRVRSPVDMIDRIAFIAERPLQRRSKQ